MIEENSGVTGSDTHTGTRLGCSEVQHIATKWDTYIESIALYEASPSVILLNYSAIICQKQGLL